MKYLEFEFQCTSTGQTDCELSTVTDILSALLADAGFEAFEETPQGLKAYIQVQLSGQAALDALLDSFPLPDWQITAKQREAEYANWNEQWEKEGFQPIIIDNRLCVHDSHHLVQPGNGNPLPATTYELIVSPRLAFGSGTHPTTRQLLEVLLETDVQGLHVIDAGCGTGILGMLCLLRGASRVSAYDIDEWSVNNTRENATLNNLQLKVWLGDASVLPQVVHEEGKANLLIANINRNILLSDMSAFSEALDNDGAQLLLSGFYEEDLPCLLDKAATLGLKESFRRVRDGWAVLMLTFHPSLK